MVGMRIEFTSNDETGEVHLRLYNDISPEEVHSILQDTEQGMEVRTKATDHNGRNFVLTDKTDRGTPPMLLLLNVISSLDQSFKTNAQAIMNRARLRRLIREGRPVTVQNMCMCGEHTGPEFDVPFQGGIVGIPTYEPEAVVGDDTDPNNPAHEESEVSDDFLNTLWDAGDSDDDDDAEREGVEV